MDGARLADLEHANMIAGMSLFGSNVEGAWVRRSDGVAVIWTGLPYILFNQVVVEDGGATPDAIASGVAAMRERIGPFVVNLRSGTDDRYVPLMAELGLQPVSERPWMPGMAWHPLPARRKRPEPGLEVRRVVDEAGLAEHVAVAAAGFEMPEAVIRSVMVSALLDRGDVSVYVGWDGSGPVTAGLGIRSGRTIGVYNIATIPTARGRGYGAAMTRHVVEDGVDAGSEVAILQASEMGYPVYERLGFRTVVEYIGYVEPPGAD
jgi:GNAT superfamily N-acetyltransferase